MKHSLRDFHSHLYIIQGINDAKKESVEVGRAAAQVEKALRLVDG